MTPGALGASVIHLPRRGYDVRSYVPMNESCRFEPHFKTSNFSWDIVEFQIQRMVLLSQRDCDTSLHVVTYNSPHVVRSGMKPREVYMTPGGAESRNEKPYAGPYATVALQGADGPANGHFGLPGCSND